MNCQDTSALPVIVVIRSGPRPPVSFAAPASTETTSGACGPDTVSDPATTAISRGRSGLTRTCRRVPPRSPELIHDMTEAGPLVVW